MTPVDFYQPSRLILQRYAQVLVDFALGSGKGTKADDIVLLQYDSLAQPLALAVYERLLARRAHPLLRQHDQAFEPIFYRLATPTQLQFFPQTYQRALVKTIDHRIYLLAESDPLYLKKIDPKKLALANQAKQPLRRWLDRKEDQGQLTWTLGLYGTEGLAKQAGLSLRQYWQQIEKACFLTKSAPVTHWRRVIAQINRIVRVLNKLPISTLRVQAQGTDLTLSLGKNRRWQGGSGRNIPSFEIFTSPDWRGSNGYISFDLPLYRYGNLIEGIRLEFVNGRVVKAAARKNQRLLEQLIKQKNADKVGEFSLTDNRFSKIDRFMANTLYDENFGGHFGNTHLALGNSYHDCFAGDPQTVGSSRWRQLGFNESAEHTDIIASTDRIVTAVLVGGQKKVLYRKGVFTL